MQEGTVDPYVFLELSKDFTLEQLKVQYKKMVLRYHPDATRDIATTPVFQLLTKCYKTLLEVHKNKEQAREYQSLKNGHQDYIKQQHQQPRKHDAFQTGAPIMSDNRKFNVGKFNQLFDKHSFKDSAVTEGYESWMSNPDSFKESDARRQLTKYQEPQPLNISTFTSGKHCVNKSSYYELGVDRIDDYSAENVNNKNLTYMDYRVAHTAQRIIDVDELKQKKEYRTIQELEADRAGPLNLSPQEYETLMRRQKMEETIEKKRQRKLMKYDERVSDHYQKTHGIFLN